MSKDYVASVSYGKDSLAMLHVIVDILHKPLTRIITSEVWYSDEIQADLPPMVEFKDKADAIIKERWGISVEHFCTTDKNGNKVTYKGCFYMVVQNSKNEFRNGRYRGFPNMFGAWCNDRLKVQGLERARRSVSADSVSYIGIAADETERVERHAKKEGVEMPLVEAGWSEAMCRQWCEENDLLSPLYSYSSRGGCWFCHNQGADELRFLRSNYPELWEELLQLDRDTPDFAPFKPNRTVADYERRFRLEDEGFMLAGDKWRWSMLDAAQTNIFQFLGGSNDE